MWKAAVVDDAWLVQASLAGSRDAFETIVERHQTVVCSIAFAITGDLSLSEDIAQETFLTAWRHLGDLKEHQKLRQWLCGISRHLATRLASRRRREVANGIDPWGEMFGDELDRPEPMRDDPLQRMISNEEAAVLWRALEELPAAYREPIVLYYRENLSLEKMAEALNLSQDVAKLRLFRGRRMLKSQLAAFVEEALIATRPRRALATLIVAALPGVIPQAAAAGTAAAVSKGSAVGNAIASASFIGMLLGPVLGLLGVFFGAGLHDQDDGASPRERAHRRKLGWISFCAILITVGIAGVGMALATARKADARWLPAGIVIAAGCVSSLGLAGLLWWGNRRLAWIRAEEAANGNPPGRPRRNGLSRSAVRLSLGGGVLGSIFWAIPISIGAGDYGACLIVLCAAVLIWMTAVGMTLRQPRTLLRNATIAMAVIAIMNVLIVHLRWDDWIDQIRGTELHIYGDAFPLWLINSFTGAVAAGAFLHFLRARHSATRIP